MHRALPARWLRTALSIGDRRISGSVPLFLCPRLSPSSTLPAAKFPAQPIRGARRCLHVDATATTAPNVVDPPRATVARRQLPSHCTGCGAFSQTTDPDVPGYYDTGRRAVKAYLAVRAPVAGQTSGEEDAIVQEALGRIEPERLKELGLDPELLVDGSVAVEQVKCMDYLAWLSRALLTRTSPCCRDTVTTMRPLPRSRPPP